MTFLNIIIADFLTIEEFRSIRIYLDIPITHKIQSILSPLKLSTITIGGSFSNILFNEEKDASIFRPKGEVLVTSCNFYEGYLKKDGTVDEQFFHSNKPYPPFPVEPVIDEEKLLKLLNDKCLSHNTESVVRSTVIIVNNISVPICIIDDEIIVNTKLFLEDAREQERIRVNLIRSEYVYPCTIKKKKSNRGRKRAEKKEKKRKTQGTGKCFNSGVQLIIKGDLIIFIDKYYKPKVYRNGSFTIPGGRLEDLSDVTHVLDVIAKFFSTDEKKVELVDIHIIMQNHKCNVILENTAFDMEWLHDKMYIEKTSADSLAAKHNIRLAEITYALDKHAGITVKFYRPETNINPKKKRNKNAKTTLKISQKCKINIDGAIDKQEVVNIHTWLDELLLTNYDKVIYDMLEPLPDSDSSNIDDTSYEDEFIDEFDDIYENIDSSHDDFDNFDYIIVQTDINTTNEEILSDDRDENY